MEGKLGIFWGSRSIWLRSSTWSLENLIVKVKRLMFKIRGILKLKSPQWTRPKRGIKKRKRPNQMINERRKRPNQRVKAQRLMFMT